MKVFVIDVEGKPCLPTKPRRAKQLLKQGKATVEQVVPFTLRLARKIDNPLGDFEIGIDDGAKHVGIAIKNLKTNEIVFLAQMDHRQDVSRKVDERKNYRKSRRYRLRCRKPRFYNRIAKKIAPSIRQKKEAIIRIIKEMKRKLNITRVIVEEIFFNHAQHQYGKFFSLVEIGKNYLKNSLVDLGLQYETTFGYVTKEKRIKLGLIKKHVHDACAIVDSKIINSKEYFIKPKRSKIWINNPTKTCTEKQGFKHYDLVKASHSKRGTVVGSIRSLKNNCITIRTKFSDNFPVSYKKTRLLQRFNGLVYSF